MQRLVPPDLGKVELLDKFVGCSLEGMNFDLDRWVDSLELSATPCVKTAAAAPTCAASGPGSTSAAPHAAPRTPPRPSPSAR